MSSKLALASLPSAAKSRQKQPSSYIATCSCWDALSTITMTIHPTHETPDSLRLAARSGSFTAPTAGHCPGYVQANLLILPGEYAEDFRLLCLRNPVPCPLLASSKPGEVGFEQAVASNADITTDVPGYNM